MKKDKRDNKNNKILLFALFLAFALIIAASFVSSANATVTDITPSANTQQPLSTADLDKLSNLASQNPEDIAGTGVSYLRSEWAKIIQQKAPFLWTTHSFLLAHQTLFKVLLNHSYEFTWSFLWILIIWLYLANFGSDMFNVLGIIKQKVGIVIGLVFAVLIAWTGVINWLVTRIIYLLTAPAAWWQRLIIWAVAIAVLIGLGYLESILKKYLDAYLKAKRLAGIEEKTEELEAESKGREEGRKAAEPIKEIRKKMSKMNLGENI